MKFVTVVLLTGNFCGMILRFSGEKLADIETTQWHLKTFDNATLYCSSCLLLHISTCPQGRLHPDHTTAQVAYVKPCKNLAFEVLFLQQQEMHQTTQEKHLFGTGGACPAARNAPLLARKALQVEQDACMMLCASLIIIRAVACPLSVK